MGNKIVRVTRKCGYARLKVSAQHDTKMEDGPAAARRNQIGERGRESGDVICYENKRVAIGEIKQGLYCAGLLT